MPGGPGGALDLEAGERFRHDEGDPFRQGFRRREQPLEFADGVLRLGFHGLDIDQREILVGSAAQPGIGGGSRVNEASDVRGMEKARHRDADQMPLDIHVARKFSAHVRRMHAKTYDRVYVEGAAVLPRGRPSNALARHDKGGRSPLWNTEAFFGQSRPRLGNGGTGSPKS